MPPTQNHAAIGPQTESPRTATCPVRQCCLRQIVHTIAALSSSVPVANVKTGKVMSDYEEVWSTVDSALCHLTADSIKDHHETEMSVELLVCREAVRARC